MKRAPNLVGDRVDSLTLRTAILVVDPIPLIMASHEAGLDELRDGSADIGATGEADPSLDLRGDQLFG